MIQLVGIAGIKKGRVDCTFARNIPAVFRELKPALAVTAAGETGSISVWIDDEKRYRASFHRRMSTLREECFVTQKSLRAWLKEWWPQMGDMDRLASL